MKSFLVVVTTLWVTLCPIAEAFVCVYQTLDSEGSQQSHHSICYVLSVPEDPHTALGEACVTVLDDAGTEVEFSFRATEGRLLTEIKFWISDVFTPDTDPLEGLPRVEGGFPDLENGFPFFWEDSTGREEFRTTIPWQQDAPASCEEHPSGFQAAMVIYAKMVDDDIQQEYDTFAFELEEDREITTTNNNIGLAFSWVDMIMDCKCHVCITSVPDIPNEYQCHALESEVYQRSIGEVCVEWDAKDELAEVSFVVNDDFELVTSYFWVGQNNSNVPSTETNELGEAIPAFKLFPNYYCDSKGVEGFEMKSLLADTDKGMIDCTRREEDQETLVLYVIAQATFTTATKLRFFPADAELSEEAYAYYEVPLQCTCRETSSVSARMNLSPGQHLGHSSRSNQTPGQQLVHNSRSNQTPGQQLVHNSRSNQSPGQHLFHASRSISCQQDFVTVTNNGGGGDVVDYHAVPVSILEVNADQSEITFAVSQTWIERSWVTWIDTLYTNTRRRLVCDRERFLGYDDTHVYTAACINGTANVNLYVRHHSFEGSFSAVHNACSSSRRAKDPSVPMQYAGHEKVAGYTVSLSCSAQKECEQYNNEEDEEAG